MRRANLLTLSILIAAPDWPNRLANVENIVEHETQFESVFKRRMLLGFARLFL